MKTSKEVNMNKEMYGLINSFFNGNKITKKDIENIKKLKKKGKNNNDKKR